jgi:hypothetical protein
MTGSEINEFESMWKEIVMASFQMLSRHLPKGQRKKSQKLTLRTASLGVKI